MSHQVCEVFLCLPEVQDAAEKYHKGDHRRNAKADVVHRGMPEQNCTVGVDETGKGIEREEPLQIPTKEGSRIDHWRNEHEKLDEEREDELYVPVLHTDGREPEAGTCCKEECQDDDHRQKDDRNRWYKLVEDHHSGEDDRGNKVIDQTGKAGRGRDEYPRHIDLGEEVGISDKAVCRITECNREISP